MAVKPNIAAMTQAMGLPNAQALGLQNQQNTLAALQPGAIIPRGMEPYNEELQEMIDGGWHAAMGRIRTGDSAADPNMTTAAPNTYDPMEISQGKYSSLGQITSYGNDPTNVADQTQMPQVGPLTGQAFLNPQIAPQVPDGSPRPLSPGEYVKNSTGSWSSEITTTTDPGAFPNLNGGKPTVIPTLWLINGVPTRVDEDTAAQLAVQSGLPFPGFNTASEAETFSQQREDSWQSLQPENASQVPALWATPPAGGQ